MTTMNWNQSLQFNELDLRITAYELQSGEKMADTVKRVQKHVMKDSARLNSYGQMKAEGC